jgi:predicted acyl esterase
MRRRVLGTAVLGAALISPLVPSVEAAPARSYDYTRITGLSTPVHDGTHEVYDVPMRDGVELHVEVFRPDGPGRFGTILTLSPYHALPFKEDDRGSYLVPEKHKSMVDYFVPRGYAWVSADLRGSGRSQGCFDYMGPTDRKDAYELVEWLARRSWSNGRVGMIGVSYPGSTPILAASMRPPHLKTIVPIAGLPSLYTSQFQNGVPYYAHWSGASLYEAFSLERFVTDPAGNGVAAPGCGAPSAPANQGDAHVSGAYNAWHAAHDHSSAAQNPIPVFLAHGTADFSVRTNAMQWFNGRSRPGDKVWVGQWGHDAPPRGDQWMRALHAWFDRHLQGRRVATGPAAEVFLNDGSVLESSRWPVPTTPSRLLTSAAGKLGSKGSEPGVLRYVADAAGHASEHNTGHVAFESDAASRDTVLVGAPTLRLRVSLTSPKVHLMGTLYDVDGDVPTRIGQATFAIQPELRDGVAKPKPVVPGELMTIEMRGETIAHVLQQGHRLRLVIASSHPDKIPTFGAGTVVQVSVGGGTDTALGLPVVARPRLRTDVHRPAD